MFHLCSMGECLPVRAQRATFLLTILTSALDLPSHGEAPQSRPCWTAHLPYVTPGFSGVPTKGTNSKVATSPLPAWGPKTGPKCYITPAFLGVPNKGDKFNSGYITPALKSRFMMRHWQKKGKKHFQPHTTPMTFCPNVVGTKD